MPVYVAVDLGAESGRVLAGRIVDDRLTVVETHRFRNRSVQLPDGLYWDVLGLYAEAVEGIAAAVAQTSERVVSIGVDGWGNDFALLDTAGALLANPRHYRDTRTAGMVERIAERVGVSDIYRRTGVLSQSINTASQLLAMEGSAVLREARHLTMLPDLITYWLSGRRVTERTIASTTQLLEASSGRWAVELIAGLGLAPHLFDECVVPAGTDVGPVRDHLAAGWGAASAPRVVAVAGHDTACAVAAVPTTTASFAYVSCGTWSLVGIELDAPITTEAARLAGFTNEAGVGGTVRFLRNGTGLWLLQECRRAWTTGQSALSYDDLTRPAATAPAFRSLVDPDHPMFLTVGDMPARIEAYCATTGQPRPADRAATVRCILESLALAYRRGLDQAEELSGRRVDVLHVVGGGAANELLCQLTADVTGRAVVAGPEEATGIGNLLVQAWADGRIDTLAQLRSVVARSFSPKRYRPDANRPQFDDAYGRFVRASTTAAQSVVAMSGGK